MTASPRAMRLLAAALAIAGALLARGGGEAGTVRVLALDASRSVRGDAAGRERALAGAGEGAGLVLFDGAPFLVVPPGAWTARIVPEAERGEAAGETDLEAALRAALDLVPPGARGEILLATDGRATRGDARAALAEARRRGVAVRPLALGESGLPARASRLEAPARVRAGERFPIAVEVAGSPGARGEAVLEDAGAGSAERRPVTVPPGGRARVVFARTAGPPGVRRYRATVEGPASDAAPRAAVLVEGPAAILRLGRGPAPAGTAAILRVLGGGAFGDAAGPDAIAAALGAADLSSLAAVVLDDLPESDLPAGGGERLRRAVGEGLGLFVLGGPNALGPGGYAGRPLEGALPVLCAPDRPRPLVVLAVDVSGSMEEAGAGGPSLASSARRAAAEAARRLPGDALLVLLPFADRVAATEGPFDLSVPAERAAAVEAAERPRPPAGGTRFAAAVEGALAAAGRASGGGARLLPIVTDGRPAEGPEPLRALGRSLAEARFGLRVLAVGREADRERLAAFADAAGGKVEEPGPGAEGIARALLAASPADAALWEPAAAAVRPGPDPGPWGAAPSGLPEAAGSDRVFPRRGSLLWLVRGDGAPLLAAGRAGLGRSAVFAAPPAAGPGAWVGDPASAVLAEAIRWTLRSPGEEGIEARAEERDGGALAVLLETLPAAAPEGEVLAAGTRLRRTGPARWEGTLPPGASPPEGVVSFAAGGAVIARAAAAPAPPAEDRALGPDGDLLESLASPSRDPPSRGGAGPAAAAAVLLALALLLAGGVSEARSSSGGRSVEQP